MRLVQRISAFEATLEALQNEITSGRWPVGEKIPSESALTKELGISRASLREAVRALVHAGMLRSKQGDGTYVTSRDATDSMFSRKISTADNNDIIEVRRGLDIVAVKLAASRRTPEDLAKLSAHLQARANAAEAGNNQEFIKADLAFHRAIVDASHNALLIDIYDRFAKSLAESINGSQCMLVSQIGLDPFHQQVFDALEVQNEVEAVSATESLLDLDAYT